MPEKCSGTQQNYLTGKADNDDSNGPFTEQKMRLCQEKKEPLVNWSR